MMEKLSTAARYTWGGDEFLFVEVDEAMSLAANFRVTSIAHALAERNLDGIVDICPANASLLVKFDPDRLDYRVLEATVREIEQSGSAASGDITTRIIEVPVWYDDPFTAEVGARFREGFHQNPNGTDLDYAAEVNGLPDKAEFIRRHHSAPWIVSMVGFVAGLPFLFQIVDRAEQLEVPKYLSPRTDTPMLTVGHGGCFAAIYSVRGAGGYQMFGVAAAPIYQPERELPDFADSSVLFRPGDVVVFRPIDEAEWSQIQQDVEAGTYRYRMTSAVFSTAEVLDDPAAAGQRLKEILHGA